MSAPETGTDDLADRVAAWIAADPDPASRDELRGLTDDELAQRFSSPLTFGTAGLRGPLQAGPSGMNEAVVLRTTAGLARRLTDRCLGGGTVVVGRDARHGSESFAHAAAEVLAAAGFRVALLPRPLPTPVVAFAVRHLGAVAGVQVTASHNPPRDNGYKVYVDGGAQLISPADREIEAAIAQAGPANAIPRTPVDPAGEDLVERYLDRVAALPHGTDRGIRIALTALHGVGGATAVAALRRAGFSDIHTVAGQFDPDPDFPTVAFPNPEEPGATDALLALAERVGADVAIALDPDADRCAVGIPEPHGWRMLTGDETGALLGDHVLAVAPAGSLVATTVVSSRLLEALAAARGARYVQTLTGFKHLVRAGNGLVYAYEEALGHCVDPDAVRDKDGISAAVLVCDLAAGLMARDRSLADLLDDHAVEFGVHATGQVSRRFDRIEERAAVMDAVRRRPPSTLAGMAVESEDLAVRRDRLRTDAVVLGGARAGESVRMVLRPSGTEPKLKAYMEAVVPVADRAALAGARARAERLLAELRTAVPWE
ncbi:phospho-sugar mutase [Rhodococcus sp. D2-41]|uniref:phospho-sugar mutase n=1 Tax=Speluncibacter jeojiensis TaxID=2710754 RepID=UPI00240F902D|nr:phospho-sugar mutase [Rhodococcus sp. D2-41]MDG3008859.1 phospho-sugar mutase [Rhodococcus sp. D2-41]